MRSSLFDNDVKTKITSESKRSNAYGIERFLYGIRPKIAPTRARGMTTVSASVRQDQAAKSHEIFFSILKKNCVAGAAPDVARPSAA